MVTKISEKLWELPQNSFCLAHLYIWKSTAMGRELLFSWTGGKTITGRNSAVARRWSLLVILLCLFEYPLWFCIQACQLARACLIVDMASQFHNHCNWHHFETRTFDRHFPCQCQALAPIQKKKTVTLSFPNLWMFIIESRNNFKTSTQEVETL